MSNPYVPELAEIISIKEQTPDVKTFEISLKDKRNFDYKPGQFVEITVFGHGEFPTSISSSPIPCKSCFETTVKNMGGTTASLHDLSPGDTIGVRGPFGNGFPVDDMKGKNVLFIAGGIGLAPIKSLIYYVLENKKDYGDLMLLYGSRSPTDLVFRDDVLLDENVTEKLDMEVLLTVDKGDGSWKGNVGVVTTLFDKVDLDPANTVVAICGPPIMIKFAVQDLLKRGFKEENVFVSLERMMSCGVGMCGHCMIGSKYVCKDGPVFTYAETKDFLEKAI